jgi:hypothetical protein
MFLGFGGFESRLLGCTGAALMLFFPDFVRHAIDLLAGLRPWKINTLFTGGIFEPVCQTIAAESGQIHEIDILHIAALAQMANEPSEHCGFKFNLRFIVNGHFDNSSLRAP